jgi:hypothetical protein
MAAIPPCRVDGIESMIDRISAELGIEYARSSVKL